MSESQKNQAVQRNQVGRKRLPIIPGNDANEGGSLKKSPGTEETMEIMEQEPLKHPHKQGVPVGSQDSGKEGI